MATKKTTAKATTAKPKPQPKRYRVAPAHRKVWLGGRQYSAGASFTLPDAAVAEFGLKHSLIEREG